ncbi:MAG: VWA domain-containing protein [Cyanobacteriota bacterium]|nr:VWA domain-containing protein [Cyanobacteriota bacterium]
MLMDKENANLFSSQTTGGATTYDPIEITKLLAFGTNAPSPDNYNEHIRPANATPATITYDMATYMSSGGGRFAYPSLFPAVDRFFSANIPDGTYTYAEISSPDILNLSDNDLRVGISQYGTDIDSADHPDRSYIFGSTSFRLDTSNATFEIADGVKTIRNIEVRAFDDNFDFDSSNRLVETINNLFLEPTLDPYKLGRGEVEIKFSGSGATYDTYTQTDDFATDQGRESDVSVIGSPGRLSKDARGIGSIALSPSYLFNIASDTFLSYDRGDLKVIYGTPGSDDINEFDAEVSLDIYFGYLMVGGAGNDNIDGGLFADELQGGEGNDTLNGGLGDDTFVGGQGNDRINGGSFIFGLFQGTDSSVYEGTLDEYDIEFLPDDTVRITDRVAGRDGSDTLEGVEQAIFSDRTINLSPGQDVSFVIDTTSSMEDDIDAVKVRASDIINSIFEGEGGFLDSRIAVVGYNDPGTNTFLSFTQEPKVDDRKTAALNAINSISVSGGGDFPEVVNAGLLRALSGGAGEWREEAIARRIILFGDAPPKDTELRGQVTALASNVNASISGSSLSSLSISGDIETTNIADNLAVTRFALQTDAPTTTPVEIFTILIGDDPETAADFQSLATATGGQSFNALDASEIVDVIISAIQAPPDDNNTPLNSISITTPIPNNLGRPQNTFSNGFYHLTELDDTGIPAEFAETPILALAGNDNLTGTAGGNYISGDQGSDTLSGLGGNDSLFGGEASDLIDGGAGDDLVWGSSDNDRLNGGDGNDSIRGGRDNDVLTGDLGNDTLWGDSGQDIMIGGLGNDIFVIATDPNVTTPIQQADAIADFEVGVDIIGLANNLLLEQLTFEPVNLQLDAGLATPSTAIRLNNDYLAIVQGVADANVFTNTNFVTV